MKRLRASVLNDVRLQQRNGFYAAVVFVLVLWGALVLSMPGFDWAWAMPAIAFGNLSMTAFYFLAGLVLLEKREGSLQALAITPLRPREYLGSKLATLVALSVAENFTLVALAVRGDLSVLPMLAGIVTAGIGYALFGFLTVIRYESINEFLIPSAFVVGLLSLPYLPYFGVVDGWWLDLHPLTAPMYLMRSAFQPVDGARLALSAVACLGWTGWAYRRSVREFRWFSATDPEAGR